MLFAQHLPDDHPAIYAVREGQLFLSETQTAIIRLNPGKTRLTLPVTEVLASGWDELFGKILTFIAGQPGNTAIVYRDPRAIRGQGNYVARMIDVGIMYDVGTFDGWWEEHEDILDWWKTFDLQALDDALARTPMVK